MRKSGTVGVARDAPPATEPVWAASVPSSGSCSLYESFTWPKLPPVSPKHLPGAIAISGPGAHHLENSVSRGIWTDDDELRRSDGFDMKRWRAEHAHELDGYEKTATGRFSSRAEHQALPIGLQDGGADEFLMQEALQCGAVVRDDLSVMERRKKIEQQIALRRRALIDEMAHMERQMCIQRRHELACAQNDLGFILNERPGYSDDDTELPAQDDRVQQTLARLMHRSETKDIHMHDLEPPDSAGAGSDKCGSAHHVCNSVHSQSMMKGLRERIRVAVNHGLKQKRILARKLAAATAAREAKVSALPESEREMLHEAFVTHAHAKRRDVEGNKMLLLPDLHESLSEVGLGGTTYLERWAVDRVCKEMIFALSLHCKSCRKLPPIGSFRGSLIARVSPAESWKARPTKRSSTTSLESARASSARASVAPMLRKSTLEDFGVVGDESGDEVVGSADVRRRSLRSKKRLSATSTLAALDEVDEFMEQEVDKADSGLDKTCTSDFDGMDEDASTTSIFDIAGRISNASFTRSGSVNSIGGRSFGGRESLVSIEDFWQAAPPKSEEVSISSHREHHSYRLWGKALNALNFARRFMLTRPVSFDEFAIEIVPAVRMELMEVRHDLHFSEFMQMLESNACTSAVTLSSYQFERVATRLGIRKAVFHRCIAELPALADSSEDSDEDAHAADILQKATPLKRQATKKLAKKSEDSDEDAHGTDAMQKSMSFKRQATRKLVKQKPTTSRGQADPRFTFDAVHELLVIMEQRGEYENHRLERSIFERTGLAQDKFIEHRSDLVRLYEAFQLYDVDKTGTLCHEEVKPFLKQIGFDPHREGQRECVERLLEDADSDGSGRLSFGESLDLMAKVRKHQKSQREEAGLQRHFDAFADGHDRMDIDRMEEALQAAGIVGTTRFEQDLQRKIIYDWDVDNSGDISFSEFSDVCQRIEERLSHHKMDEIVGYATSLGIELSRLSQYLWAFDQLSGAAMGNMEFEAIHEVLHTVTISPPSAPELMKIFEQCGLRHDLPVPLEQYLQVMHAASDAARNPHAEDMPFSCRDVPVQKLRELLSMFPISADYIRKLEASEMADILAGYLNVAADTNLRKEAKPVANVQQLFALSRKTAAATQQSMEAAAAKESSSELGASLMQALNRP